MVGFSACELLSGSPDRDNQNDPGAAEYLDYYVTLTLEPGIDYIGITYDLAGDTPFDEFDEKIEVIYGTDTDINSSNNSSMTSDSNYIEITGLSYGNMYNFWLKCTDEDSDELIFQKHISAMPEAIGKKDDGFATNGKFELGLPYTSSEAYDLTSNSSNEIFIGAGSSSPVISQPIIKLTSDGSYDSSFGISGVFDDGSNENYELVSAMCGEDVVNFLARGNSFDLESYKNSDSRGSAGFQYGVYAAASAENYVYAGGINYDSEFSIVRFDSTIKQSSSLEYSVINADLTDDIVMYSEVIGISYKNEKIYGVGIYETEEMMIYKTFMHAVILDADNMTLLNELEFNADWDDDQERRIQIGTPGPMSRVVIAADNDNNVYIAGAGIISKFSQNGDVFDIDSNWQDSGSRYFVNNYCPEELLVQDNDKILLFTNVWTDIESDPAILEKSIIYRFNNDGTTDTSFGTDGSIENTNFEITGAEVKSDGRIIVSGNEAGAAVVYQYE